MLFDPLLAKDSNNVSLLLLKLDEIVNLPNDTSEIG